MGANHTHGTAVPSSRRTLLASLAVLVPLAIVTLAGLLWLWPDGLHDAGTTPQTGVERLTGTVTGVTLKPCPAVAEGAPQPDPATCGNAAVKVGSGPDVDKDVTLRLPTGPGAQRFAPGDDVILLRDADGAYQISDHDRTLPLWFFGAAFALAVIAFGRWRGLTALVGLAITFVLLLTFVIPGILEGKPPMLVAIVGSAAIMLIVLYLTHGFSPSTSMAVLGTLASLALTGALSYGALGFARLNGITDDAAMTLGMSLPIDTQGLLLAGIIIGALGVLDDVTVTQAVTVAELAHANPSYGFARLYRAAGRIGRAHIASVINTIILAYAGASLPLLLLFSIGSQPLGDVLTTPVIAQEIVRSVAGTLGLIAAVPITTALAALAASRRSTRPDEEEPSGRRASLPGLPGRRDAREDLSTRGGDLSTHGEAFFSRRDDEPDDDFFSRQDDDRDDFFSDPDPGDRRETGPDRPHDTPIPEGGFFTPAARRSGPPEAPARHPAEHAREGDPADRQPARHRRRAGA
ncbi:YibE/F family protein [Nonomuraea turkmeniaca]|uniref:YibE/F family protein n=1 Tax=Nonomuraea turkmeniaca TaxID=103838 RepID=A0A5S4F328_9ACTN|nr:YibE/F family protein [Nonomuraea turkmeniaca]TMR10424.1 YibE/F family protein [Nonomuraea turkmeniaca]